MNDIKKWFNNLLRRSKVVLNRTVTGIRRKAKAGYRAIRARLAGQGPKGDRARGKGAAGGEAVSIFTERTKRPNFVLSVIITTARMFFLLVVLIGVALGGALLGVAKAYVESTPNLDMDRIEDQSLTSYIRDADGNLITAYRGSENRIWAGLDEIPEQLQQAYIAIEDVRFRQHNGIDIKRIAGAFLSNMTSTSGTEGGSTITQQIIKLRLLSSERSYKRKLQEAYLAMQLEQEYSKDDILETYLNMIHLGESNYGVKAAALDYFGKPLDQLTLRECALLAGLTQNPYSYNPRKNYYDRDNPERTDKRTNTVLERMMRAGFITRAEYDQAMAEQTVIIKEASTQPLYKYPHFVEYVIKDVVTHLLKQQNLYDTPANRSAMEQQIRTKGWTIYTTIKPEIQDKLEQSIYNWDNWPALQSSGDSEVVRTLADGTIETTTQPQVGATIIDWREGTVVGMVGSRTPPTAMKTLNRAADAALPIGSSIKPISVYGPALDKGASPATIYNNVPLPIEGWISDLGYPRNYGGGGFTGPVTMREGVIKSLNTVAARTLLQNVGTTDSYNYLINLGVSKDRLDSSPSGLALGTAGISTLDLAGAYATIANKGLYQQPISFTVVKDGNNNVVLDARTMRATRQVFKPSTSWMLVDMLTNAVNGGTGGNARIPGITTAGKTGTNSDWRGITFAGITPYYASAIWIGHDNNKSLSSEAQGGRYAAPLWKDYMTKIHEGLENQPIIDQGPEELGLIKKTVCRISGKLPTTACGEDVVTDWFLKGTEPTEQCDMHIGEMEICTITGQPAGEFCPEGVLQKGNAVFIPEDSELRNLPLVELQTRYGIPGATFTKPGVIDPNNPNAVPQTCTLHTQQWHEATLEAQRLVASVTNLMDLYQALLTQEQQAAVDQQIAQVRAVLAEPTSDYAAIVQVSGALKGTETWLLTDPPQPQTPEVGESEWPWGGWTQPTPPPNDIDDEDAVG